MAEEKPITPEENAKKTLSNKLYQEVLGLARVKQSGDKFSQLVNEEYVDTLYENSVENKDIKKEISEHYNQEKYEITHFGLPGQAQREDLNQYALRIAKSIEANMQILNLGDLESIIKEVSGQEFNIPEAIKKQGIYSIAGKPEKEMNNYEKGVVQYYQLLNQIFWKATSLNAVNKHAYGAEKAMTKELGKKYNPNEIPIKKE